VKAALLAKRHTGGLVSDEPLTSDEPPRDPAEALEEAWRYCLTTDEPPEGIASRLPELFDPSVRLDFSERIFNPAVHEGHAGVAQWRTELCEIWESFRADPQELFRAEDVFVVFVAEVTRGRVGGAEVTRETAVTCTIRDNRIAELRSCVDRTRALREAGLGHVVESAA